MHSIDFTPYGNIHRCIYSASPSTRSTHSIPCYDCQGAAEWDSVGNSIGSHPSNNEFVASFNHYLTITQNIFPNTSLDSN
jgi:hypothetical protein